MKNLIYLDTETTGLKNPRMVEIGYCMPVKGAEVYDIISHRFNPGVPIDPEATAVHGITDEAVKEFPLFKDREEYTHIKELLENNIVVAHNAKFDIRVMLSEGIEITEFIDTQKIAKKIFPGLPSYGLQALREKILPFTPELFDAQITKAHTAVGDVIVLAVLFKKITDAYYEEFPHAEKQIMIEEFISDSR